VCIHRCAAQGYEFLAAQRGERRTTQALQLDTAEQAAEQYYFELRARNLGKPGVDRRATDFSPVTQKSKQLLKSATGRCKGPTSGAEENAVAPPRMRPSVCYNSIKRAEPD
jgi:hypothetical protein